MFLQNLRDLFNQLILQSSLWTQFTGGGATITYDPSGVTITYPASSTSSTDGDLTSNQTFDLTGSFASLQVLAIPDSGTSADAEMRLKFDANNYFRWLYEGGTLYAQYLKGGSRTNAFSVAYDATLHKYWKISESAGIVTWWTSTDGSNWISQATFTHGMLVTAATMLIAGTCFQAETSPGTFKFNNFNTLSSVANSTTTTVDDVAYNERLALRTKLGITDSTFSLADLRKLFYGGKVSQNDAIRAYLQSQTGLTTIHSLNDLWRQFFLGKGLTNQVSLTDMAKAFFINTGF